MKNTLNKTLAHLGFYCWPLLMYIMWEQVYSIIGVGSRPKIDDLLIVYAADFILYAVSIYLWKLLIMGRSNLPIRVFRTVLLLSITCLFYLAAKSWVLQELGRKSNQLQIIINKQLLFLLAVRGSEFFLIAIIPVILQRWVVKNKAINDAQILILKSEVTQLQLRNEVLRLQMSPHFLFNTLNFLYDNVRQVSVQSAEIVLRLADQVEYALMELPPDGKVSLGVELEYLKNYLELIKMTSSQSTFLNFSFPEARQTQDLTIAPAILLPLVENVKKHGDLSQQENAGQIEISVTGNTLQLTIRNLKRAATDIKSYGIGNENILERMELLYAGRYVFNERETERWYELDLIIQL